jgi:hypothetical protein
MSRARRRLATRLLGWVLPLMAAVVLFTGVVGQARAEHGRPAGWQVERATERATIGRLELRYEPAVAKEAAFLLEHAPRWWVEIERAVAVDLDDTLLVTFVDHAGGVAEASGMPRWVAGVAHPPRGEIMIARHGPNGARTDLANLLKHEMAHVALHRATGGADLPRWFHEGVAESLAGGISFSRAQTLASAVFGPGVPNLENLEASFRETDGPRASVAYAASRDLVTYLRYRDGTGASLKQVLSELRRGTSFEAAFVRAYGVGLHELVAEWREGLPARFVWYSMLASGGLPFALVVPLVAIAWIRRRRVLRRGWERLEREDELAYGSLGLQAT